MVVVRQAEGELRRCRVESAMERRDHLHQDQGGSREEGGMMTRMMGGMGVRGVGRCGLRDIDRYCRNREVVTVVRFVSNIL